MVALRIKTVFHALGILATSSEAFLHGLRVLDETSLPRSNPSTGAPPTTQNETARPYAVLAVPGTQLAQIHPVIKKALGKGQGSALQIVRRGSLFQGYCANLTEAEAIDVSEISLVERILATTSKECRDIVKSNSLVDRLGKRAPPIPDGLRQSRRSISQLQVLSQPNNPDGPELPDSEGRLPNYLYDPELGKGQDIYIIDTGFNLNHRELLGRVTDTYVISNQVALKGLPRNLWPQTENTIAEDDRGHGTIVASIAAGNKIGVAPRANLILVKAVAPHEPDPDNDYNYRSGWTKEVLEDVFGWIRTRVKERQEKDGFKGKSIVNISLGGPIERNAEGATDKFEDELKEAWKQDIVVVIGAGNKGKEDGITTEDDVPQIFGKPDNPLITVGGVNYDGTLDYQTTPRPPDVDGSLTVYALSDSVVGAAAPNINRGTQLVSGTSAAAPIVAGLLAYWASLDSLKGQWEKGSVAMDMKRFLIKRAFKRTQDPLPDRDRPPYYPLPDPDSIIVAYNGAWDGLTNRTNPYQGEQ